MSCTKFINGLKKIDYYIHDVNNNDHENITCKTILRSGTRKGQECGGNCNYAVQCEAPDGRRGIKQSWSYKTTNERGAELHETARRGYGSIPTPNYNDMIIDFNTNKQKASNKNIFRKERS